MIAEPKTNVENVAYLNMFRFEKTQTTLHIHTYHLLNVRMLLNSLPRGSLIKRVIGFLFSATECNQSKWQRMM